MERFLKTPTVSQTPPSFNHAAWLAQRYRLPIATARLIAELAGIGVKHPDIETMVGGAAR